MVINVILTGEQTFSLIMPKKRMRKRILFTFIAVNSTSVTNRMKQLIYLILISAILPIQLSAKKYGFEEVKIIGVENPLFVTISPDGLKMIIVDVPRKGIPAVKQTIRTSLSATWGGATSIPEINDLFNEETSIAGVSYSYNGKYLCFSSNLPDSKGGNDLYSVEITPGGFSPPVNLGSPVNSEINEYYPSVSGNERELFFTRETEMKKVEDLHPGKFWLSRMDDETGHWLAPEKLNVIINDAGIGYPRISDDNKTIFYSRVDEEQKKWKIHWTKRIGDIHWYLPVVLDTIRSDDHEVSPSWCKQDGFIYYVKLSGSESSPKGQIFRFKPEDQLIPEKTIEIKGTVTDSVNRRAVRAFVLVTDPILGRRVYFTETDGKTGQFKTLLLAEKQYLLHIWKDQYSHYYKLFTPKETVSDRTLTVMLTPQVNLTLNIYDKDELWPLEAELSISNEKGQSLPVFPYLKQTGLRKMILPIGNNYRFRLTAKDYVSNILDLDLSDVVLFDQFTRDIELEPMRRELEIFVTEKDTILPLDADIEFTDKRNSPFIPAPSKGKGYYSITLREGEPYEIDVRGPRYYAFRHLSIDLDTDRQMKRLTVGLTPLTRKVPIRLNNINFELNSADLIQSSYPELDRVVRLLSDNPDIYVELSAHTCDIGSDRFNDLLSLKRARSVVNYLTINGISYKRMVARGYGEKQALVPNISEENRMLNRRVELKILDENDQEFQVEERIKE